MDRSTESESSSASTKRRSPSRGWRFVVGALAAAALITLVVRATVVDFFYIGSTSMESTLNPGNGLLVNRLAYKDAEIQRGDVVIFDGRGSFLPYQRPGALDSLAWALRLAGKDAVYVKRVIGVGGDTVTCCGPDGRLSVNGIPLEEPYVLEGNKPSDLEFDVKIPEGRLWIMGDHRSVSEDSRALLGAPGGGMIPVDRVIGKVTDVIWPLDRRHPVEGHAPAP
ncbi:signal peptidase I [Paeniglutamicibacter psychrophenolicus]|nr:signal peptidase I [Paeniglutamicibacter psychrophenolicus]MDQ0093403.1 signal peptidase I [Paeniglutamicibacter psychrophenolicus]